MISKDRLLAITDGIVAIAATIMVLELTVPVVISPTTIVDQWPILMAYIISFVQIFLAWHEHHDSFANAELINHRMFLLNCLWLFFITLMPFATCIIGRDPYNALAVLMYTGVLFMEQLTISLLSIGIQKLNNCIIRDGEIIRRIRIITLGGYLLSAVGTMIIPLIGLFVILALTFLNIVLICLYDRKLNVHAE